MTEKKKKSRFLVYTRNDLLIYPSLILPLERGGKMGKDHPIKGFGVCPDKSDRLIGTEYIG
jgi:hypothetical protein